jgi:hypothetical protein
MPRRLTSRFYVMAFWGETSSVFVGLWVQTNLEFSTFSGIPSSVPALYPACYLVTHSARMLGHIISSEIAPAASCNLLVASGEGIVASGE